MRIRLSLAAAAMGLFLGLGMAWAEQSSVVLTPPPQEVAWPNRAPLSLSGKSVALVVGQQATEPERYAAELLQSRVAKRFGQEWPIVAEGDAGAKADVVVLLGQPQTHARLGQLCKEHNLTLNAKTPGFDGYLLEMVQADGQQVILVGGCNERGVIYGTDTLFQLVTRQENGLVVVPASVRDCPTVPWRGRPQTRIENYFRPGELDLYMISRVNWIDLREGIYAFEPETKLDKPKLAKLIKEAHRRGLLVYGTVNCGIARSRYKAALNKFREFLELGADGLWTSFDDKGPGDAPEEIVTETLRLGREFGLPAHRLAVAPPKSSYQEIDTEFNRTIMAIPGAEEAFWAWSRVPSAEDMATAKAIGLKCKPSWWHNWPRFTADRPYSPPPAMAHGWHGPDYERLSKVGDYCEMIMPWGGNAYGQYYIAPVLLWWAWNPADHDWTATRSRIYRNVYGADLVDEMLAFDDAFDELLTWFAFATGTRGDYPPSLPRLKDQKDRERVLDLLTRMDGLFATVEAGAAADTMISEEQLEKDYLGRMRNELKAFRAMAQLPYPEYWWNDHQRQVLNAVYDGDLKKADQLIEQTQGRVLDAIAQAGQQLEGLRNTKGYGGWWTQRAKLDGQGWRKMLAKRKVELADRTWTYGYLQTKTSTMLAGVDEPPLDWGTGRWERTNKVIAKVMPEPREMFWGGWMAGPYEFQGKEAVVFAAERKKVWAAGDFAELPVTLPLKDARHDRLAVMVFLSNTNKDSIGLHHVPNRWSRHRFVQLVWEDKVFWEADLGPDRETGQWFVAELPEIPADVSELNCRLRVIDKKLSVINCSIAFTSPIWLVELAE